MKYNVETFSSLDFLCEYLNFWKIDQKNIVGIYQIDPGWKLLYLTNI